MTNLTKNEKKFWQVCVDYLEGKTSLEIDFYLYDMFMNDVDINKVDNNGWTLLTYLLDVTRKQYFDLIKDQTNFVADKKMFDTLFRLVIDADEYTKKSIESYSSIVEGYILGTDQMKKIIKESVDHESIASSYQDRIKAGEIMYRRFIEIMEALIRSPFCSINLSETTFSGSIHDVFLVAQPLVRSNRGPFTGAAGPYMGAQPTKNNQNIKYVGFQRPAAPSSSQQRNPEFFDEVPSVFFDDSIEEEEKDQKEDEMAKYLREQQYKEDIRTISTYKPKVQSSFLFDVCYYGATEVLAMLCAHRGGELVKPKMVNDEAFRILKSDKERWTPMQIAVKNKHIEIVSLLLKNKKADVNKTPSAQNLFDSFVVDAPLMIALKTKNDAMIKLLVDNGADLLCGCSPHSLSFKKIIPDLVFMMAKNSEYLLSLFLQKYFPPSFPDGGIIDLNTDVCLPSSDSNNSNGQQAAMMAMMMAGMGPAAGAALQNVGLGGINMNNMFGMGPAAPFQKEEEEEEEDIFKSVRNCGEPILHVACFTLNPLRMISRRATMMLFRAGASPTHLNFRYHMEKNKHTEFPGWASLIFDGHLDPESQNLALSFFYGVFYSFYQTKDIRLEAFDILHELFSALEQVL